jgi:hypothetical protein
LFYKENLLEVSKISALGNQKLRNYSNELLWEAILAKIFDNQDFQFIANNNLNLVGVPFRFRFQARLLNYISSEPRFEKYFTLSHFINRGVSATINFFKRVVRKTMSLSLELRN